MHRAESSLYLLGTRRKFALGTRLSHSCQLQSFMRLVLASISDQMLGQMDHRSDRVWSFLCSNVLIVQHRIKQWHFSFRPQIIKILKHVLRFKYRNSPIEGIRVSRFAQTQNSKLTQTESKEKLQRNPL